MSGRALITGAMMLGEQIIAAEPVSPYMRVKIGVVNQTKSCYRKLGKNRE